jgi:hypothetical protein
MGIPRSIEMKKLVAILLIFSACAAYAAKVPDLSEKVAQAILEQGGSANPKVLAIVYKSTSPRLQLEAGEEIATVLYTQIDAQTNQSKATSTTFLYSHINKEWMILIPTNDDTGYFRVTEDGAEVVQSTP